MDDTHQPGFLRKFFWDTLHATPTCFFINRLNYLANSKIFQLPQDVKTFPGDLSNVTWFQCANKLNIRNSTYYWRITSSNQNIPKYWRISSTRMLQVIIFYVPFELYERLSTFTQNKLSVYDMKSHTWSKYSNAMHCYAKTIIDLPKLRQYLHWLNDQQCC